MGVATSLVVMTFGAILAFAVNVTPSGINIQVVGWILMIAGAVALVISIVMWDRLFGPSSRPVQPPPRRSYPPDEAPTRRF